MGPLGSLGVFILQMFSEFLGGGLIPCIILELLAAPPGCWCSQRHPHPPPRPRVPGGPGVLSAPCSCVVQRELCPGLWAAGLPPLFFCLGSLRACSGSPATSAVCAFRSDPLPSLLHPKWKLEVSELSKHKKNIRDLYHQPRPANSKALGKGGATSLSVTNFLCRRLACSQR